MPLIRSPAVFDLQVEIPQAAPAAAVPSDNHDHDHTDTEYATEYAPSEYAETEVLSPVADDNYEEHEPDEPVELWMSREHAREQWAKLVNHTVSEYLAQVRSDEDMDNEAIMLRARQRMTLTCKNLLLAPEDQLRALRFQFQEIVRSTTEEEMAMVRDMQDEVVDLLEMDPDELVDLWFEAFLEPAGARMVVQMYMYQLQESLRPATSTACQGYRLLEPVASYFYSHL
ncbi:hypothetical protein EWM64_g8707 [Hericium alpestre]|uniref:Uncharacterized protein n=1 Tax=Hericium alpestre TaxID=135208 RepID=A0A4Y9ZMV0_9AGAM|nr:hypothetical protein EWM64_g8707 [Hericium alpestre]